VPCGYVCDRAWRAGSWDAFTIPKPGARVVFWYEAPVHVERDADEAAQARATETLKQRMLHAEQNAFERLGREVDW